MREQGEWLENFRSPPAACRPQLQWSWNGRINAERIRADLEDFKAKGIGGFFMHARPGLELGYLEEEWFELWKIAADHCRELGLEWHIYDEYTCPGGVAGGHTVAHAPHVAAMSLRLLPVSDPKLIPEGEILAWFEYVEGEKTPQRVAAPDLKRWPPGQTLITAILAAPTMNGVKRTFPKPDLTEPDATRAFLACTHERYRESAGEHFGTTTRYCFCDEPALYHSRGLLMSSRFLLEFKSEHGFPLQDALEHLCFDTDRSAEVRYAYWATMHRLWQENFMQPMFEWCEDHHLLFTGHFMENKWPRPGSNPDCMASYRWMHAPGNDLLGFQFKPESLPKNALYLLNLKELTSAAAQLGRQNVMVESSGANGYGASYALFKGCEDLLLSVGVNVMDPHLSHWSVAGARKYDWAQTLSKHSPWWECYRSHADHVSRIIAAQREGQEINRVLVLHPTLTGWLYEAPDQPLWHHESGQVRLEELKEGMLELVVALGSQQIDYDLGDEFLMAEFGRVEDGKLRIGERSYGVVVVPALLETCRASTLKLLRDYLQCDGKVVATGDPPSRVEGRPSGEPVALARRPGWEHYESVEAAIARLRKLVPPRITGPEGSALDVNLVWRRTALPSGATLWLFACPWRRSIREEVTFDQADGDWFELDTSDGTIRSVDDVRDGMSLELEPLAHRFLLQQPAEGSVSLEVIEERRPTPQTRIALDQLHWVSAGREDANLLVIDYGRLMGRDGEWGPLRCTHHLDKENWKRHGFSQNPWSMNHQFRRNLLDYPFQQPSGCRVLFECELDLSEHECAGVEVVVERPGLYRVEVNGTTVSADRFSPWFEPEFGKAIIGEWLRHGKNQIELVAETMTPVVELMPIYLRGEFSVWPDARGFRVSSPRPIERGDWRTSGAPFYRGWMHYHYEFEISEACEVLAVEMPEWKGGAMCVSLDDANPQDVLYPRKEVVFRTPLAAGRHRLELGLASTLLNMLGPHHSNGLSGPWSWDAAPAEMPAGKDYLLQAAGVW